MFGSTPLARWPVPRLLTAVLAGAASGLAWQPYGLWPLLLLGPPVLTVLVGSARPRAAFGLGYGYGLAMLAVSVNWIHVLGIWVAVALIAFEALFLGLLGLALRLTAGLRWWQLAAACCWVGVEFAYSRVPFGGFGWVRLGYAVVDTPLAGFYPYLGVAGVSFLVAWLAQLPVAALRRARGGPGRPLVLAATLALAVVGSGGGLRLVPPPEPTSGTLNVGIVQGNVPGRGIEALGRMRSVTNNHLSETINLVVAARQGRLPEPDFILWPENSTDIDPTRDPVTRLTVQSAVDIAGVPIFVGAVMAGPGRDERQTSGLWWDPERGVVARYDKRNLVPFGEWIPFRDRLLPVLPILRQVGAQSVPGTRPGVLDVTVADRPVKVGDVICFELAYDRTVYETITAGAQLLMVQSNNATYGGTGQIEQQFAITRARAMETRREIAVATTNSVSGLIAADGRVVARTAEFTAASMVVSMPLRGTVTPAVLLAPWLDRALAIAAALAVLTGLHRIVRARSRRPEPRAAAEQPAVLTQATTGEQ